MKRLNRPLAGWLLLALGILAAAVHTLHGYQVRRSSDRVLADARRAEQDDQLAEAFRLYGQYVRIRPDDAEQRTALAKLAARVAKRPEATPLERRDAFGALENAVRRTPDDEALRRELIEFALHPSVGEVSAARDHLRVLLARHADDPDLLALLLQAERRLNHPDAAIALAERLLGFDPSTGRFDEPPPARVPSPDIYSTLATLYRQQGDRAELADAVLDRLVELRPDDVTARLRRAEYLRRFREADPTRRQQQWDDLAHAARLEPDNTAVLVAQLRAARDEQLQEVRRRAERRLQGEPGNASLRHALATSLIRERRLSAARAMVEAGLQLSPRSFALLELHARLQLASGDLNAARTAIRSLAALGATSEQVELLQAELELTAGQAEAAVRRVLAIRSQTPADSDASVQADLVLLRAYDALRQSGRVLETAERIAQARPGAIEARIAKAVTLAERGQHDAALGIFDSVEREAGLAPLAGWPRALENYLRLRLQTIASLPSERQDWSPLDRMIESAEQSLDLSPTAAMVLRAEVLLQQQQRQAARELLAEARQRSPDDLNAWLASAALERLDPRDAPRGLELLDEARRQFGTRVSLLLAELDLAALLADEELERRIASQRKNVARLAPSEQAQWFARLGEVHAARGDVAQAEHDWNKAIALDQSTTVARFGLFELAREQGDANTMREHYAALQQSDAEPGIPPYAEAVLLLAQQGADDPDNLSRARRLADDVLAHKPTWPQGWLLAARIDVLLGDRPGAIQRLEQALAAVEQSAALRRELLPLLVAEGRTEDAYEQLRALPPAARVGVERLEVELLHAVGNVDEALQLAQQFADTSARPEDQLWYVEQLQQAGKHDQAMAQLGKLVQRHPTHGDAWLALCGQYLTNGDLKSARQTMQQAGEKLEGDTRTLTLARGFAMLGETELADEQFRALLTSAPGSVDAIRLATEHYLATGRAALAAALLESADSARLDASPRFAAWRRRSLALATAASGSYADHRRAMQLLQEGPVGAEEQSLRAELLAGRGDGASWREAIDVLRQLETTGKLSPTDRLLLATLLERTGDWPAAREQTLMALAGLPDTAAERTAIVGDFARRLIQHGEVLEAETWLSSIESAEESATRLLRIELLLANSAVAEATDRSDALLDTIPIDQRSEQALAVATLWEQAKQHDTADRYWQQAESVEGIRDRAKSLVHRGRLDESLALLAAENFPVDMRLSTALEVLRADTPSSEQLKQVRSWAQERRTREPRSLATQYQWAEFCQLAGNVEEAVETYQTILSATPTGAAHAAAANNLAYLLAMTGQRGEALRFAHEALEYFGPTPDVLDTRGLAHLQAGDLQRATDDLRTAVRDDPTSSHKRFHLALACFRAGNEREAAEHWQSALEQGLRPLPLERRWFEELDAALP